MQSSLKGIQSAVFKILCMTHNQINTIPQSYSKLQSVHFVYVTDGQTGGGTGNYGGWLQIVILSYSESCFRFMNQKSRQAKIPQSRWDIVLSLSLSFSFSSHSGNGCITTLLSSAYYSVTFTGHLLHSTF